MINTFYNQNMVNNGSDNIARNKIHQIQDENYYFNDPDNYHANTIDVNNHQYQGSGKQFENQKEFDLDLYRSELATINELPHMGDNMTTECTHPSPINSDNLRNPQLIQNKTLKHLNYNGDVNHYINKNFDKS